MCEREREMVVLRECRVYLSLYRRRVSICDWRYFLFAQFTVLVGNLYMYCTISVEPPEMWWPRVIHRTPLFYFHDSNVPSVHSASLRFFCFTSESFSLLFHHHTSSTCDLRKATKNSRVKVHCFALYAALIELYHIATLFIYYLYFHLCKWPKKSALPSTYFSAFGLLLISYLSRFVPSVMCWRSSHGIALKIE